MNHKCFAVWLTGLPGAGKSVISESLKHLLEEQGIKSQIIRMDEMRKYVTPNPKYTHEERQLIYNAFSYTAKLLVENNANVIMDATGNLRKYRALAKEIIPNYLEIYLKCPLEVAIRRETNRKDTKEAPENIYERASEGKTKTVPGLQVEYEEPSEPDLIINTNIQGIKESAEIIFSKIESEFQMDSI
jgi:adenylylsulfate kinase